MDPSHQMKGNYEESDIYPKQFCNGEYNQSIVLAMLVFDVLFSTVCLFLFIKPLIHIIKSTYLMIKTDESMIYETPMTSHCGASSINGASDNFILMVVKYTNLSFICLLAPMAGLLMLMYENATTLIPIDNMFICLSILFMSKAYEPWYFKTCRCLHAFWLCCCKQCCMGIDDGKGGMDKSVLSGLHEPLNEEVVSRHVSVGDDRASSTA